MLDREAPSPVSESEPVNEADIDCVTDAADFERSVDTVADAELTMLDDGDTDASIVVVCDGVRTVRERTSEAENVMDCVRDGIERDLVDFREADTVGGPSVKVAEGDVLIVADLETSLVSESVAEGESEYETLRVAERRDAEISDEDDMESENVGDTVRDR